MNGESTPGRRWITLLLCLGAIGLGVLAVKRAVNGNADLSGNHKLWRSNLTKVTIPVRREGQQPQDPDSYPPITYAIYAPLGALPLWAAATLWYALNVGCTVYLLREAQNRLQTESGEGMETSLTVLGRSVTLPVDPRLLLTVIAVLPAWIGSVQLGQNALPLMALTWSAFQASRHGQPWLAGGLLALATVMKVFPVVFILPFILRWNWRVLFAYAVIGLLLVIGLGGQYFGHWQNIEHHLRWLRFAVQGPVNRPADPRDPNSLRSPLRYHNQSVEVVLAHLLMNIPITNQSDAPRVNIADVSAETWRRARAVTTGILVFLGLLALYRSTRSEPRAELTLDETRAEQAPSPPAPLPRVRGQGEPKTPLMTSLETYAVLSLLQLFVSPIVWSHYYVWLFWPLLLMVMSAWRGQRSGWVIYLAWLAAMPLMAVPQLRAVGLHLWLTIAIYLWLCWPIRSRPLDLLDAQSHEESLSNTPRGLI